MSTCEISRSKVNCGPPAIPVLKPCSRVSPLHNMHKDLLFCCTLAPVQGTNLPNLRVHVQREREREAVKCICGEGVHYSTAISNPL